MGQTGRNSIDLNSDVGESFGNWSFGDDAAIIDSVSSVNVACGFHAGDPSSIRTHLPGRSRGRRQPSVPTRATATWPASDGASLTWPRPS